MGLVSHENITVSESAHVLSTKYYLVSILGFSIESQTKLRVTPPILSLVVYLSRDLSSYGHHFVTHQIYQLNTGGLKFQDLSFRDLVESTIWGEQTQPHSYVENKSMHYKIIKMINR